MSKMDKRRKVEVYELADRVVDERGRNGAANFADALAGSRWDLPDSEFGWRKEMRQWAELLGLVEQKEGDDGAVYIALSEIGLAVRKELHERGVTLFVV